MRKVMSMTQPKNLPEKNNPLRTSYRAQRRKPTPEMDARIAAFWDGMKTANPPLYQKHLREEAAALSARMALEASLDDPELIAVFEHYSQPCVTLTPELTLLGLEPDATKRDVRNAYRRKARKLHPDAGGDEAAFKQLYTAYRRVLAVAKA
jgi:hypothetical protein